MNNPYFCWWSHPVQISLKAWRFQKWTRLPPPVAAWHHYTSCMWTLFVDDVGNNLVLVMIVMIDVGEIVLDSDPLDRWTAFAVCIFDHRKWEELSTCNRALLVYFEARFHGISHAWRKQHCQQCQQCQQVTAGWPRIRSSGWQVQPSVGTWLLPSDGRQACEVLEFIENLGHPKIWLSSYVFMGKWKNTGFGGQPIFHT